jgi:hypothetical protein
MGAMVIAFYKTMYTTEGTTTMDQVLGTVSAKVMVVMNENLMMAPFEKEEIKGTYFKCSRQRRHGWMVCRCIFSSAIGIYGVRRLPQLFPES